MDFTIHSYNKSNSFGHHYLSSSGKFLIENLGIIFFVVLTLILDILSLLKEILSSKKYIGIWHVPFVSTGSISLLLEGLKQGRTKWRNCRLKANTISEMNVYLMKFNQKLIQQ